MPALQYWFSGAALAAFIALLGASLTLGYGWYRAAITEMQAAINKTETVAERAYREQVKTRLGKAVSLGNQLLRDLKDKDDAQATSDADAWGRQTYDLIVRAYGDGEGELFLDSSGYVFYGDGSKKNNTRNWIDGRLRRLTELVQRTDRLIVRQPFDPSKFD
jgi:hypothetical protein